MVGVVLMPAILASAQLFDDVNEGKTLCTFKPGTITKIDGFYDFEYVAFVNTPDKYNNQTQSCSSLQIDEIAHAYSLDPALLLAVIMIESNCNQNAIGAVGEVGLGQIRPEIWGEMLYQVGITDISSAEAAAWVLAYHINRFGEYDGVRRYNGSGPKAEAYRDRVLATRDNLKKKM